MDTARMSAIPKDAYASMTTPIETSSNRGKVVASTVNSQQAQADRSVTYRASAGDNTSILNRDNVRAEDLIPPYDALKIDALNEDDHSEDGIGDVDMQEDLDGKELMVMADDDLLG